jgi:methylated-DNA-[protein]-cysteine S-methyltransferase
MNRPVADRAMSTSVAAFALFPAAIGGCAMVWRYEKVIAAFLPEADPSRMRSRLESRFPAGVESDPPAPIATAIELVVQSLSGLPSDLGAIEIDLSGAGEFERSVYAATRAIPRGEVRTYGEIARMVGMPGAARAVGAALGRNPIPIVIPCHRVIAAAGGSGGFSAPGGVSTKFRILAIEGARRGVEPELFETLPMAVGPKTGAPPSGPSIRARLGSISALPRRGPPSGQ